MRSSAAPFALVHPDTGGTCAAVSDAHARALATLGWEPVGGAPDDWPRRIPELPESAVAGLFAYCRDDEEWKRGKRYAVPLDDEKLGSGWVHIDYRSRHFSPWGRFVVPQAWSATLDFPDTQPFSVLLRYEVEGGLPRCRSMTIEPERRWWRVEVNSSGRWVTVPPNEGSPGTIERVRLVTWKTEPALLSSSELQDLRLGRLRQLAENCAAHMGNTSEPWLPESLAHWDRVAAEFNQSERRPSRRRPSTRKNMEEVARVYKEAMAAGRNPTQAVADQLANGNYNTAKRWVRIARHEYELLPLTRQGSKRAG